MTDSKLQQAYLDLFREFEANKDGILVDAMQANPLFDKAESILIRLANPNLGNTEILLLRWEWREAVREAADLYASRRMFDRASQLEEGNNA